jgi:hypothetical protein
MILIQGSLSSTRSPDDVAGCRKRKLNFSDFGFGTFEVDFGLVCHPQVPVEKAMVSPTDARACGGAAEVWEKVKPSKP